MTPSVLHTVLALASSPLLDLSFTYEVVPDGSSTVHLIVGLEDRSWSAFTFITCTYQPGGVEITLESYMNRTQAPLPNPLPFAEACVVHKVNEVALKLAGILNFHLNGGA